MADIYDQNAYLGTDFTYQAYSQPPPPAPTPIVEGGTTVITTINGGGGGRATGPSITIGSNWAGVNFVANGNNLNLDIQNAVTARGALGAAAAGVNTDITQLNGASQVDVTTAYKVAGTKVVGAQQPAIPDAAGGVTIDVEARAALNTLLAELRLHGLIDV
jgi:hypothetical protein